jgi:hypothetical protein
MNCTNIAPEPRTVRKARLQDTQAVTLRPRNAVNCANPFAVAGHPTGQLRALDGHQLTLWRLVTSPAASPRSW